MQWSAMAVMEKICVDLAPGRLARTILQPSSTGSRYPEKYFQRDLKKILSHLLKNMTFPSLY